MVASVDSIYFASLDSPPSPFTVVSRSLAEYERGEVRTQLVQRMLNEGHRQEL